MTLCSLSLLAQRLPEVVGDGDFQFGQEGGLGPVGYVLIALAFVLIIGGAIFLYQYGKLWLQSVWSNAPVNRWI